MTNQALDRRTTTYSARLDREIPLPTPEDFILLKAAYWRHPSRSRAKAAQDGVDIEAVLQNHREDLDRSYLEENARKLDLWEPLTDLFP